MKKIVRALSYTLLFLVGCVNFGCHNGDIPDHQRIWWYEKFDNNDEIPNFMTELKNAGKNGDFNFGLSEFDMGDKFKRYSIRFAGHIANNQSKTEDIFNSVYSDFRIEDIYNENTTVLPIYSRVELYFYPLSVVFEEFDNKKIECVPAKCTSGEYEASFNYCEELIMKVKLTRQSNEQIDKEKMISELISNYKLIV